MIYFKTFEKHFLSFMNEFYIAPVAQLVAHQTSNLGVAGSIPARCDFLFYHNNFFYYINSFLKNYFIYKHEFQKLGYIIKSKVKLFFYGDSKQELH